jgi:23S rRNA (uracil1939-C5)-methyltransferase
MKRRVVEDAWQRANLRLPPDTPVLGMDNPWRYRIRGEFEALYGAGGVRFGFHRMRSYSVFPIKTCPIHDERIERGLFAFQQAVNELSMPGIKHLLLTTQPDGPGLLWQVRLDGPPIDTASLGARVAELLPDVLLLDDSMDFGFWGLQFRVRSDTFVQANHRQMQVLYRTALDMLAAKSSEAVLDLYAGIGTITLAIARDAASVTAVEENPHAINLGRLAARINAIENVRFLPGKVENALHGVRVGEHAAVVMDPPRAGLDGAAIGELLRLQPDRIVYVSCEPPTQVRDLSLLVRGGYRIRRAAIVDMFPQTYHIESVVLLERGSASW